MKIRMQFILIGLGLMLIQNGNAQYSKYNGISHEGEFGFGIGAAHYFGDLNTRIGLNRPKPAITAFYRKQFGNYVAARIGATFAQLGYSDVYSKNQFQKTRNLSFNTNIWELTVQGDFNFFQFNPIDPDYIFTPYVTIGAGIFGYDPYAYLEGKKYFLRPLGTEGQGTSAYPDRKKYSTTAIVFPIGAGFKYSITPEMNLGFEILYRVTSTDYLDDVSTTYAGANLFSSDMVAQRLQDRSYEFGTPIGVAGRQRGFSGQKDHYVTAIISLSFNLSSYKCPSAK
ncbi:MAG TPA: DUF6089 family protein [Chitinophagaceae bacterium]|nr:DUF6089 family protein [Chitinophagaceae bacterium]